MILFALQRRAFFASAVFYIVKKFHTVTSREIVLTISENKRTV